MQFWQCSISLQFLQIITAKDFAFGSLQNLQLLTSADCSVSLHAMVHCNSKCIAVIPLQFHCNSPVIVCSVALLVLKLLAFKVCCQKKSSRLTKYLISVLISLVNCFPQSSPVWSMAYAKFEGWQFCLKWWSYRCYKLKNQVNFFTYISLPWAELIALN